MFLWDYSDPCNTFPTLFFDLAVDAFFMVAHMIYWPIKERAFWSRSITGISLATGIQTVANYRVDDVSLLHSNFLPNIAQDSLQVVKFCKLWIVWSMRTVRSSKYRYFFDAC